MPTANADAAVIGVWLWDVLFAGSAVVTAVLVALSDTPVPARVAAAAVVLGLGAAWLLAGRRLGIAQVPDDRPAVLGYSALLVVALVVAVVLVPESTWALFVVVPQMFWLLRLARAVPATVVLTLALPVLANLVGGDPFDVAVRVLFPQGLFMTAFGLLVGVWIHRVTEESDERARLIAELERTQAEVAELSHRAGVAAERERLAGEIHDTLAQGFTSIVTLLQAAQAEFTTDAPAARRHVALAVRAARDNLREARHLVAASTPSALTTHSLADAIGRQVERFADETRVDAASGSSGTPRRLPAEHEVVLLRAAQELLTNVTRHAGAGTVTVRLDFADPATTALTVADDGAGFDPTRVGGQSFGLAMMRARVARLGGTMELDTAPGAGTTVTVTLPGRADP